MITEIETPVCKVEVSDYGNIYLPDREFTASDLKKIAVAINKYMRSKQSEEEIGGIFDEH